MAMQSKLWTISELSVELDIDRRTMAKRLEGCEPEEQEIDKAGREHRRYRLAAVFAHLLEGAGGSVLKLDDERARLAKEQADRASMDNEVRRGELLDAAIVGQDIENAFNVFRQKLLSAPTKLAPLLSPEKPNAARDVIAAELERILAELHEHFERAASGELREDAGAGIAES
jgi:phage terminase Nu1 subunit (DNA packaging protein)